MVVAPDGVFSSPSSMMMIPDTAAAAPLLPTAAAAAVEEDGGDSVVAPELSPEARELLFSTEEFVEPAAIGEALPNGGRLFREWEEARRKELGPRARIHDLGENYDSDPHAQTQTRSSSSFTENTAAAHLDDAHRLSREIGVFAERKIENDLTTRETFPSEYLSDPPEGEVNPEDPFGAATRSAGDRGGAPQPRRRRKSALFPPASRRRSRIETAPPPPPGTTTASGIVVVAMGRRVRVDRSDGCVDDDDGDDSAPPTVYSLLRAWVRDDPDRAPARITRPSASRRSRRPLSEYVSAAKKTDAGGSDARTVVVSRDGGTEGGGGGGETLDVLGWLSADHPLERETTVLPFYPTPKQMRELRERREAKRRAKAARKKRLAAARESLRRKGIRI